MYLHAVMITFLKFKQVFKEIIWNNNSMHTGTISALKKNQFLFLIKITAFCSSLPKILKFQLI